MKRILCAILMTLGLGLTAYAAEDNFELNARNIEITQDYVDENSVKTVGSARGMLISAVELAIEDLGNGSVNLWGQVLCHKQMKKVKLNMILEQWIPADEDWSKVERFEHTWLAEDYPDDDLSMEQVSIDVSGLERGQNYRLRAVAGAWDYDSNYYEVWNAKTESILVE